MSKEEKKDIKPDDLELEELEEEPEPEEKKDNLADILTSKELDTHISKKVDEKVALALDAHDDEEEPEPEEEPEKGLGAFPLILIGGILAVAGFTLFNQNRPISHPTEQGTQNDG